MMYGEIVSSHRAEQFRKAADAFYANCGDICVKDEVGVGEVGVIETDNASSQQGSISSAEVIMPDDVRATLRLHHLDSCLRRLVA